MSVEQGEGAARRTRGREEPTRSMALWAARATGCGLALAAELSSVDEVLTVTLDELHSAVWSRRTYRGLEVGGWLLGAAGVGVGAGTYAVGAANPGGLESVSGTETLRAANSAVPVVGGAFGRSLHVAVASSLGCVLAALKRSVSMRIFSLWVVLTLAGCGGAGSTDATDDPNVDDVETDSPAETDPGVDTDPPADTDAPPEDTDAPPEDTEPPEGTVLVPAGTFTMGSPPSEPFRALDEAQVSVTLTRDVWMMRSEVTQGLYEEVFGENPSFFDTCGADCPVEQVSWYDAVTFANLLSERDGLTPVYAISGTTVTADWGADGWRLPTEAEWERAARGGESFVYAGGSDVDAVAWTTNNSGNRTQPVCTKEPNAYGLCDMSGNVWEWTWDWYAESRAGGTDPAGASSGSLRVLRGGSWGDDPSSARVAGRNGSMPGLGYEYLGFRLARSVP